MRVHTYHFIVYIFFYLIIRFQIFKVCDKNKLFFFFFFYRKYRSRRITRQRTSCSIADFSPGKWHANIRSMRTYLCCFACFCVVGGRAGWMGEVANLEDLKRAGMH